MPSIPPETLPEPVPRARPGAMLAPLAAVVVLGALPLAAASGLAGGDWGVPSLAALPAWVGPGSIVLALLLAAAAAWLAGGDRLRAWAGPIGGTLLAGFAVLAWCARSATLVYGDGLTLVSSLLDHAPLPPLEPLAQGTHVAMFTLWRALGARARVDPAWDAISAVSVLSGVLAVLLLVGIARRTTADLAEPAPARVFLPALVLAHGHVVLFFGYPENYAPVMAAVLLYIACACSALCAPRFAPWAGVALAVACLTHAMAIVLVPSYVALLWSLRRERPAWRTLLEPLAAAALLVAGHALLTHAPVGLSLRAWFRAGAGLGAAGSAAEFARGAGARTFMPFVNGAMLLGPFTLGAAATALPAALPRLRRDPLALFAALVLVPAAGLWMFGLGEWNLGYARNWDVGAPLSLLVMTSACVLAARVASPRFVRGVGTLVLAASLVHTIRWVAVCADESATLARFDRLPLTAGERASTLGLWAAMKGDDDTARRRWLDGLASEPDNVRLLMFLGRLGLQHDDVGLALASFTRAREVRPDMAAPLAGEVLVLLRAQQSAEARRAIERHAQAHPGSGACAAVVAALGGDLAAIDSLVPTAAQWRALEGLTRQSH